jgi:hypothetical protein
LHFLCRLASSFVSHEGLSDKKKNSTGKEWEGSAWSIKVSQQKRY